MSLKLAPEDKKVAITLAILFVTALVVAGLLVQTDSGSGALPTSYSTGNDGTKAAFLLLQQTGYSVDRWTASPKKLAEVDRKATLVLVEPIVGDERDVEAVREFVKSGGRVVATGMSFSHFVQGKRVRPGIPHFQWKEYRPKEPSDLTRGIAAISMAPKFYFDADLSECPFADGDEYPVTRFSYGAGEVIWWSSFDAMSNSGIREKDNVQLLLNSIGDPNRGPVLWDEYFHQGGKTVIDSVIASPLKWGLLQVLLIALVACFTYSRRFGPLRQSVATPRLATMEFVETLAALYKQTATGQIAVEIVYEHFRSSLQRKYAVRTDATPDQVAQTIASHLPGEDQADLAALVRRTERAVSDPSLKVKDATAMIRNMHELSKRLKLKVGRNQ